MKKLSVVLIIIACLIIGVGVYLNKDIVEKKSVKTSNKIEFIDIKNSIFGDKYEDAYSLMKSMSIEEKIGQLFLVRYDKNSTNSFSNYYPGGYLLFAKDFDSHDKKSIKSELDGITSKVPLTFAVDEEGGYVTRISRYTSFRSEKFKSPKYYYETGGEDLLENTENEKAQLLLDSGINLNLAPVADVSTNEDDFMYIRTFGYDANKTSELIGKMVSYANNMNISSCLKHFPGYGNNVDTHTGSAYDNRDYSTFTESDYLPFIEGIKNKVPCILVSHNVVSSIDGEVPASLSLKIHEELRNKLNFSGIIITDDLDMDAVNGVYEDAAVRAVNAGNDVIITSDFINDYNKVLSAYKNGDISKKTIDKAVTRIIAWKYTYNII